jgi:hypothetical protein
VKVLVRLASFNAAGSYLRVFPDEMGSQVNSKAFRKELGFTGLK